MLGADKRLLGAQEKVDSLNKQKNQLIYAQEESQSLAYLERQIRDKLKMVQPGETLVVLPSVLQEKVEEDVYKYHTQADYQSKTSKPWQEWWLLFQ